jgi:hypothetical protein
VTVRVIEEQQRKRARNRKRGDTIAEIQNVRKLR